MFQITPEQLRSARHLLGVSREEMARRCGLSTDQIGALERGGWHPKPGIPITTRVERLQEVVGMLESLGARFVDNGVVIQRTRPDYLTQTREASLVA